MKAHSVKSNAKRAARKVCEEFSGIDPVEPVTDGKGGWLPAVTVAPGCLPSAIAPEVSELAIVVSIGVISTNEPEDDADVPAFLLKGKTAGKSEVIAPVSDVATDRIEIGTEATIIVDGQEHPATVTDMKIPTDDLQALARAPAVKSSPEEIAARRAARMERTAEPKPTKPESTRGSVTVQALDMMRRPGGATANEMREHFGWVSHTLRGFVSRQNSNHKRGIVTTRGKTRGEPTVYHIPQD